MADPAAANKLLAMLKAGGSKGPAPAPSPPPSGPAYGLNGIGVSASATSPGGPSAPSPSATTTQPFAGTSYTTHLHPPPPAAHSPIPSVLSPPPAAPGSRAVSLNDLFANIGSTSASSANNNKGASPAPSSFQFTSPPVSPMPAPAGQATGGLGTPNGNGNGGAGAGAGAAAGVANGDGGQYSANHLLGMLSGLSGPSLPAPASASPAPPPGAQSSYAQTHSSSPVLVAAAAAPAPAPASTAQNGRVVSSPAPSHKQAQTSAPMDLLGLLKKVQSRPASAASAQTVQAAPAVAAPVAATSANDGPGPAEPLSDANLETGKGAKDDSSAHVSAAGATTDQGLRDGMAQYEAAAEENAEEEGDYEDEEAYDEGEAAAEQQGGPAQDGSQPQIVSKTPAQPATSSPASSAANSSTARTAAAATAKPVPNKTIFDFVSPFDMFTKPAPKPKPSPQAATAAALGPVPTIASKTPGSAKGKKKEKAAAAPAAIAAPVTPTPAAKTAADFAAPPAPAPTATATANGKADLPQAPAQPAHNGEANTNAAPLTPITDNLKDNAKQPESPSSGISALTATGTRASGDKQGKAAFDASLTWQVGTMTKGQTGTGPCAAPAHITIDLSQPNLSALVNDKQAVQVVPTTIVKATDTSYRHGRMQGMTEGWLAYGLSKGKIRLIDRSTGSRLVITLGGSAANGQIIDMAVTPTLLAVVGADHSISAYRIPRSWSSDDPTCDRLIHLYGPSTDIGTPFKVEWVRKGSEHLLAIGGANGVVLIDPAHAGKRLDDVVRKHKVLIAEGALVDFCLNQTHQAIGLLSATSVFSLYSLATLNRVWHRPFPTHFTKDAVPSSVTFVESNLLVGRDQNTKFDLVQITTDLAVLGSITLTAPPPCPADHHYAHAIYDAAHQTVWVAPFARGSLIGVRYAIKGHAPIIVSQGQNKSPWDVLGEIHSTALEPIVSLTPGPTLPGQDLEVFYGDVKGFSMATIQGDVLSHMEEGSSFEISAPSQPRVGPAVREKQETVKPETVAVVVESEAEPTVAQVDAPSIPVSLVDAPSVPAPTVPATPLPAQSVPASSAPTTPKKERDTLDSEPAVPAPTMSRRVSKAGSVAQSPKVQAAVDLPAVSAQASPMKQAPRAMADANGVSEKTLKKMEDRIVTQTRQAISSSSDKLNAKVEAISAERMATQVAAKVEKLVKGSLVEAVREEVKKTLSAAVQHEIRQAVPAAIATSARQVLPAELERELGSLLHHILPGAVQAAVDRSVHSAVQRVLMPEVANLMGKMFDEVMDHVKEEILQIKKDMSPPPTAAPPIDISPLVEAMAGMQKQIAALTEQVSRQAVVPPPQPPAPSTRPPPADVHPLISPGQVPPPLPAQQRPAQAAPARPAPQVQLPSSQELEDAFLTALSQQNTVATVKLVNDFYHMTEYCLPLPARPTQQGVAVPGAAHASPLSAAVKITLLHRLALALGELPLNDPAFTRCLDWQERVAIIIDPSAQEVSAYYPRVKEMVLGQMGALLQKMGREGLGESGMAFAVRALMDGLARKG